MNYVNGWTPSCKTKKALREAVKAGTGVYFYGTSAMGPQYEGYVADVPVGVSLSVVGPDPYTDRRWYAQVSRSKDGKVKVA
jgi:hypothetical protein